MIQWGAVSFAHFFDTRMVGLSWADRGVLYHLALIASTAEDSATVVFQQRPGEAVVATWTRALGAGGAESVGRLIEQGLLQQCAEGLRIVLKAEMARRAPDVGDAWVVSQEEREGPADTPRARQKPSTSATARRFRHDLEGFTARSKGWGRIPRPLSWPAWLQTPEGESWTSTREEKYPGYRAWVARAIREGGTQGVARGGAEDGTGGGTPSETNVSSENSENREKEKEEDGTGGGTHKAPPTKVPPPTGRDLLLALRGAAGSSATLTVGGGAFERDAARVLADAAVTLDETQRMGEALTKPSEWWPPGKDPAPQHCTWKTLAGWRAADGSGYEWGPLLALIACVRARQKAIARRPATPPETTQRPLTREQYSAQWRALNATPRPEAQEEPRVDHPAA